MSENIQSISQGTYTIGQTSATNFVAGPGIKIDEPSAGTVRIGTDETVLWEGDSEVGTTGYKTIDLSEAAENFECIKVYMARGQNFKGNGIFEVSPLYASVVELMTTDPNTATTHYNYFTTFTLTGSKYVEQTNACGYSQPNNTTVVTNGSWLHPYKIVGINRISGSNV